MSEKRCKYAWLSPPGVLLLTAGVYDISHSRNKRPRATTDDGVRAKLLNIKHPFPQPLPV